MPQARKVPITERALLERINRKLADDDEIIKKTDLGYYRLNLCDGTIVAHNVDMERLGRVLGVFRPFEVLAAE
jgi:hypothetical protein